MAAAAWYVRTDRRVPVALVLLTAAGVFLAVARSQTFVFAVLVVPVLLLRTVPSAGGPDAGPGGSLLRWPPWCCSA